ncbi:MAG: hypothetical protein AMJ43_04075 [Coxiella sp. DG_40]|nr:MAG: hypothetical protein AMJ43_04075 [Coxiella sp. DG_40]
MGNSKQSKCYNISLTAQRSRILSWLSEGKTLTTFQARNKLEIMHPSGRVLELRQRGWNIKTDWTTELSPEGVAHRVAKYFLAGGRNDA